MTGSKKWQQPGFARYRLIGLLAGPVLAAAILVSPAPDGLSQQGWWTGAVGILMAAWWMPDQGLKIRNPLQRVQVWEEKLILEPTR